MDNRVNVGYEIISSFTVYKGFEYVIGYNKNAAAPFVVWDCSGGNDYSNGRYFSTYKEAAKLFCEFIKNTIRNIHY